MSESHLEGKNIRRISQKQTPRQGEAVVSWRKGELGGLFTFDVFLFFLFVLFFLLLLSPLLLLET
jgi:hypothetical protein